MSPPHYFVTAHMD